MWRKQLTKIDEKSYQKKNYFKMFFRIILFITWTAGIPIFVFLYLWSKVAEFFVTYCKPTENWIFIVFLARIEKMLCFIILLFVFVSSVVLPLMMHDYSCIQLAKMLSNVVKSAWKREARACLAYIKHSYQKKCWLILHQPKDCAWK